MKNISRITPSLPTKTHLILPPWLKGKWGNLGILFIVYILFNLAWTYFHWGGPQRVTLIANLLSFTPSLLASILAWRVAAKKSLSAAVRRAWLILGMSFFSFLIGNLVWAYLEVVLRVEPFPSLADVFYLAFYPLGLWGLLYMPGSPQNRHDRLTFSLDMLIMLTAAAMFVGYFIIVPTAVTSSNDFLTQLIASAYPIGSLLLMGGILAVLYRHPSPDTRSALSLVLIGMIFFLSSDFAFGYAKVHGTYTPGSWIDAGWNVAPLFFGLAALRQMYRGPAPSTAPRWITLPNSFVKLLPFLTILLGFGLVFYVVILNNMQAAVWLMDGALLLTLLVIVQQVISPAFADLPVRVKMILTFILVSILSVILVCAMAYLTIRSNLEAVVGDRIKADVEFRAQTLGNEVSKQIDLLQGLVLGETIEYGVAEANTHYTEHQTAIEIQLPEQGVPNNIVARELDDFRHNFPDHDDLLLTDQHGWTIAATTRPDNYFQATEEWWQLAYNHGRGAIYVGQPTLDPATRHLQIIIAVPVQGDHTQDVIGVIRTSFRLQNILEMLPSSHLETQAGFSLLLPGGQLLDPQGITQYLEPDVLAFLQSSQEANYAKMNFEGKLQLISQARVVSSDAEDAHAFKALNWRLIVHEESTAAFAPLFAASQTTLLTLLFVLFLTSGVAVVLAQALIAPISRLTHVASQIAAGNLTAQAEVESKDEIGRLASTFNMMVQALSQTQLELQESEALYRSLVDYSPDMIAVHCDGKYVFINPAGVKLLGAQSADELLGKNILDMIPEEGRDIVRKGIEYLTTSGGPTALTQRKMYHMDGTSFEAEYRAIPITYAGQPAVQLVAHDITERKQAEEKIHQLLAQVARQRGDLEVRVAERTEELNGLNQRLKNELTERQHLVQSLQESEHRFRLVFDTSPDAILLLDPHEPNGIWKIVDCNQTACNMNGYSREELIGQSIDIFNVTVSSADELTASLEHLRHEGVVYGIEATHRHKDGHFFPIEYSTSLITLGDRELLLSVDRDITERKQSEEALRLSEEKYRNIFENVQDVFYTTDYQGNLVTVSPSIEKHSGYRPDEVIGKHVRTFFMNEKDYEKLDVTVSTQGLLNDYEMTMKRKDNSLIHVSVTAHVVFGKNGRPVSTEGVMRDITERKKAEEALRLANVEMERALRMKDEFLTSMSHELRTPLTGILGLSEALQYDTYGELNPKQKTALVNIESSGRHLLDLINDILDIAKMEAGKLDLQMEPYSLSGICQAALQLIKGMAHKKNQNVAFSINPTAITVLGDARRLKQVLVNLLSNAVKYSPENSAIGLEVIADQQTKIVKIAVWDHGIGIAIEDLKKLFQPFVQLDSSLSRQQNGTGLGLALVEKLVNLHGGSVEVESTPGAGSRFTVTLSVLSFGPVPQFRNATLPSQFQRALIVEDNSLDASRLSRYLKMLGIESTTHATGAAVVERVIVVQPDIILLDLLLPETSGWEVLKQLKSNEKTSHLPVVVTSVEEDRERASQLGAAGYLIKFFSQSDLYNTIARLQQSNSPSLPQESPKTVLSETNLGTVMLVDDNEINTVMLEDFLRSKHFNVVTARSGLDFLSRVGEIQPDVVLMDIQMPGIDGLETTQRLRAHSNTELASVPVIAITALAMPGDRERCLQAGANEYLSKPLRLEELRALIQKYIEKDIKSNEYTNILPRT